MGVVIIGPLGRGDGDKWEFGIEFEFDAEDGARFIPVSASGLPGRGAPVRDSSVSGCGGSSFLNNVWWEKG